ncbi:hypothetical protein Lser_V15G36636 [Lactuca serriola]
MVGHHHQTKPSLSYSFTSTCSSSPRSLSPPPFTPLPHYSFPPTTNRLLTQTHYVSNNPDTMLTFGLTVFYGSIRRLF